MSMTKREIAEYDVKVLEEKGKEYGDSWKKRGGIGAFMMLARKWDRIENQCEDKGWDIFKAIFITPREEGILDDIGDLRRYLILVEEEMRAQKVALTAGSMKGPGGVIIEGEAGKGYVNQDPEYTHDATKTILTDSPLADPGIPRPPMSKDTHTDPNRK